MGEVIQIDPEYYRIKRALALYEDKDIVIFKELAEGGAFTANLYRLDPVVVLTREHLPLLEQEIRRRQEAKVKRSPVPFVFLSREDRRRIEEVGGLADTELAMLKRFLDLWQAAITTLQGVVVTRDYLPFIEQEIELRKTTPKSIGGFWVLHSALLLENATPNLIAVSINECTSPAGVESVIKRVNDLLRKHKMEFPTPTVEEP